jgi:hypothetical protein
MGLGHLDRARIGIILVSLILSTTLILFIAGSRIVDRYAEIIEFDLPSRMFVESAGSTTFHQLVVTKKPSKRLDVASYCLSRMRPVWRNQTPLTDRLDYVDAIEQIHNKVELCSMLGLQYTHYGDLETTYVGTKFDIEILDFSVLNDLSALLGEEKTSLTAEALAFNRTSGQLAYYFEGETDFFWDKGRNLDRMEIRTQDNLTAYYPDELIAKFPQYPSIRDDSPAGKITLLDAGKNSRVELTCFIKANPSPDYTPPGSLILLGTVVIANGEIQDTRMVIAENRR